MAVVFADSFTAVGEISARAPDVGDAWIKLHGEATNQYRVVTGMAEQDRGTVNQGVLYLADADYGDDYSQSVTIGAVSATTATMLSLITRVQDDLNFYALVRRGAGNAGLYLKTTAGWTLLGGAGFSPPVVGDVVTLEVVGDTLTVKYNGIEQAVRNDSTFTTGLGGLGGGGGAASPSGGDDLNSGIRLDDYSITADAGEPPPPPEAVTTAMQVV